MNKHTIINQYIPEDNAIFPCVFLSRDAEWWNNPICFPQFIKITWKLRPDFPMVYRFQWISHEQLPHDFPKNYQCHMAHGFVLDLSHGSIHSFSHHHRTILIGPSQAIPGDPRRLGRRHQAHGIGQLAGLAHRGPSILQRLVAGTPETPWADGIRKSIANCKTGWWLGHPSEKYESQLGWLATQYTGK